MVDFYKCQMVVDSYSRSWFNLALGRKATPIYLLVLRAQEVGNEPFWNKKKVEKCDFFIYFIFFRVWRLGLVAIYFYQPILN